MRILPKLIPSKLLVIVFFLFNKEALMTTDRYTKFILTIIALNLATIALHNAIPSAFAQSREITKVAICNHKNPNVCAEVVDRYGEQLGFITYTPR